ncbi:MAG: HAMP domain-containing histidine kinase [Lachnospiraceae bacterium]|nr:HAMP domain-containing histidine kinase [Lachnospiraceae bacterium]
MKKAGQSKQRVFIMISVMIFLIIAGVAMTIRMLTDYGALVLQNTDNQLISLARSVDLSAESQLERYMENLIHTMAHVECKNAEEIWKTDKNVEEPFRQALEGSLLGQDEKVADILILDGEKLAFSQSGELDYKLLKKGRSANDIEVRPCIGGDGTTYMAILREEEGRAGYAVLVNLAHFYEDITVNLSAELQNEIIMMDADVQALVHRQENEVVVDEISLFSETDSKFQMLEFLISQQEKREEGMDFCDAVSSATGRAYEARMAVVPATEDTNGVLAIGVSTDYDEVTRPMRFGMVQLICYGGVAFLSVVSLIILLLRTFRGSEQALREVELLQEKNAAMEALNRQTQEFAHHQRLELMGTLTSGIAHEFNNLLAPIMGYSILILEKLPPEETELYDEVLEIYNTSRKAKTVVSRLQDLARKNAGTDFHKLILDDVVRKVVEIANPAKPKSVEVQVCLNAEGCYIMGNETQISQLLLNLLINAFHATEAKRGSVMVSTEVKDNKLLLTVSDNGYGISESSMKRIFEPFFTTKKGGEGTGLGLAIAEQVVEEHQGSIKVESKEGEGTTFFVDFPIFSDKS